MNRHDSALNKIKRLQVRGNAGRRRAEGGPNRAQDTVLKFACFRGVESLCSQADKWSDLP